MITEVGGTVGDIEILPFLEAIRQFRKDVGRENVFYVHVTLVPFIGPSGEQKTKPTQHSVTELRSRGIQPDAIVCRSDRPISDAPQGEDRPALRRARGGHRLRGRRRQPLPDPVRAPRGGPRRLRLSDPRPRRPGARPHRLEGPRRPDRGVRQTVRIGLVGKYVNLPDAYLSVVEALRHGGFDCGAKVEIDWIASDDAEGLLAEGRLRELDGIVIPGGFGFRGIEGKIAAVGYARGAAGAVPRPVPRHAVRGHRVRPRRVRPRRGQLLGVRPALAAPGDRPDGRAARRRRPGRHDAARPLPGASCARARWSRRPTARRSSTSATATATRSTTSTARRLEEAGLVCSGTSPDDRLVEFVELPPRPHPFFVATQAHPEFKSRPDRPHPLFAAFVRAARERADGRAPAAADGRPGARRRRTRLTCAGVPDRRAVDGRDRWVPPARRPAGRGPRRRGARAVRGAPSRRGGRGAGDRRRRRTPCWSASTGCAVDAELLEVPGRQARRRRRAARGHRAPRARGGDRPPGRVGSCRSPSSTTPPGFCDEYTYLYLRARARGARSPQHPDRGGARDADRAGRARRRRAR